MRHLLRRHPFAVDAYFRRSLVLTYAYPAALLAPLLPPGLSLDTFGEWGFVAMAMVQTENLRPSFVPAMVGRDFFLSGYRIFARYRNRAGVDLRGLRILRSDTDRRVMVVGGNLFTHYAYRHARVTIDASPTRLAIQVASSDGRADVDVDADLATTCLAPPASSPFRTLEGARHFAGPLPYTFDYERETHSMVLIKGVRKRWDPRPVHVTVRRASFFEHEPFSQTEPRLAAAFHLHDVPYHWQKGVVERLGERGTGEHGAAGFSRPDAGRAKARPSV